MRRRIRPFIIATITLLAALLFAGCGGGHITPPALPPIFTSTPPSAASEGAAYSYQMNAIEPAGKPLSYSLTTAPAGATLTGNTISWTPTSSQSRQPNSFTVTATNSASASATQSWTVTPTGTVHVTKVDTVWGEVGATELPYNWSLHPGEGLALVPQPDGSTITLTGTGGADGRLNIPNVPAGYFWLQVTPATMIWTTSSNIDLGGDYNSPPIPSESSTGTTTTLNLNITNIDPMDSAGVYIHFPPGHLSLAMFSSNPGLFTERQFPLKSTRDFSQIKAAAALQYKELSLGSIPGATLTRAALLSNLALTNGTTNDVDLPLTPSPVKSADLNVAGSAWNPLFARVAPGNAAPHRTQFGMSVSVDIARADIRAGERALRLFGPIGSVDSPFGTLYRTLLQPASCRGGLWSIQPSLNEPVLLDDQNMGNVQYGDPFPETWAHYFEICQEATVDVPAADGSTQRLVLSNGAAWRASPALVQPLIGPVETPSINDHDLFTPAKLSAQNYTLKWAKPTLGEPTGYLVRILSDISSRYVSGMSLLTAKTTMTLPSNLLVPGRRYLFLITALTDGRADVETSPNRTGFPAGNADVVSAPITIEGAGQ